MIDEYRINYKIIFEKNKLKVNDANFTELNSIINEFNGKNFKEKGITYFKDNYHNVIINTIKINNKKINIESSDFIKELQLEDSIIEQIPRAICIHCFGYSKKGKPMLRIFSNLRNL